MDSTDQILEFLFDTPPEGAVDYLKSQGYEVSGNSDDIINAIKNHAFTVAKVATADKLQKIHDELKKAMDAGTPYKEWLKSVKDTVPGKTNWQTVYRTNMSSAYNSGRYVQQMAATEYAPFWQHFCPIDSRTRPLGHTLNGLIYRYDDPHWDTMYPPNEYNDRDRIGILSEFAMQNEGLKAETEPPRDKDGKLYEPAKGFASNPAKTTWKPDLSKYSPDIRAELEKVLGKNGTVDKPMEGVLKTEGKKDIFKDRDFRDKVSNEFFKGTGDEDTAHHLLAESQGFTGKPKVLSEKEINKLKSKDYHTVYRGLTDVKFYEQFKNGEYFSGRGIHGSGTYTGKGIKDASDYTSEENNKIMKMLIPKNANLIDVKKLTKMRDEFFTDKNFLDMALEETGIKQKLANNWKPELANTDPEEYKKMWERNTQLRKEANDYAKDVLRPKYGALYDVGNFATANGYDGIYVKTTSKAIHEDYIVMTNRSKCIVQDEYVKRESRWID